MIRLFKKLRKRRQLERDLEDELRFHLDTKAAETGDVFAARRQVGNLSTFKEDCRGLWTFAFIEGCWQDLRHALRTLSKNPGFVLVAIAALAFGIGADTAVFTIGSGAFTYDLGIDHPERIVILIGLAVGLPLAFGVTRVLRAALIGVSPGDPVTFLGVVLVLLAAGLLGCAIPVRRPTRVDPLVALRSE